jgi:flavorubredoxin
VAGASRKRAVVVYDTMWGSTQILARSIGEGIASKGVEVMIHCLSSSPNSDIITDILETKAIIVGSPTLNNHIFPSVAGFLAYLRGLKPLNKIGAAFGSYGWAGGAKKIVESEMQATGIQMIESDIDFIFKPNGDEAKKAYTFGHMVGDKILGN